jgi:hypothetical protein|tara:strand:- start:1279 stop:1587 length:309 start_codon:yes stop_codon:yes gene_type:complete
VSILKKIYVFSCLILLSGCVSSTAFLGPIFTGAKTGSVYQASISYGGNKILNKAIKLEENENFKLFNKNHDKSKRYQEPTILLTYVVDNIEISEVSEPEPLP